jgi:hypothetical protein
MAKKLKRIRVPIFGKDPVPGGRLYDILNSMDRDLMGRVAHAYCSKWDIYFYEFPSREDMLEAVREDECKCPKDMGGDAIGLRISHR